MDGESDGAVCEVDHGLYFPLAGRQIPGSRIRGGRGGGCSEVKSDGRGSAAAFVFAVGDGCAGVFGVRWADDAEWVVLQV